LNHGWDSTPRRQNNSLMFRRRDQARSWRGSKAAIAETREQATAQTVFINAWYEWAEGAYLEPDARFGHT